MRTNFKTKYWKRFQDMSGIMRADVVRLLFLYKFGGIYADMDAGLPQKNASTPTTETERTRTPAPGAIVPTIFKSSALDSMEEHLEVDESRVSSSSARGSTRPSAVRSWDEQTTKDFLKSGAEALDRLLRAAEEAGFGAILGEENFIHQVLLERRPINSPILSNAVMIGEARHPFWLFLLEKLMKASGSSACADPVACTGPRMLDRLANEYANTHDAHKAKLGHGNMGGQHDGGNVSSNGTGSVGGEDEGDESTTPRRILRLPFQYFSARPAMWNVAAMEKVCKKMRNGSGTEQAGRRNHEHHQNTTATSSGSASSGVFTRAYGGKGVSTSRVYSTSSQQSSPVEDFFAPESFRTRAPLPGKKQKDHSSKTTPSSTTTSSTTTFVVSESLSLRPRLPERPALGRELSTRALSSVAVSASLRRSLVLPHDIEELDQQHPEKTSSTTYSQGQGQLTQGTARAPPRSPRPLRPSASSSATLSTTISFSVAPSPDSDRLIVRPSSSTTPTTTTTATVSLSVSFAEYGGLSRSGSTSHAKGGRRGAAALLQHHDGPYHYNGVPGVPTSATFSIVENRGSSWPISSTSSTTIGGSGDEEIVWGTTFRTRAPPTGFASRVTTSTEDHDNADARVGQQPEDNSSFANSFPLFADFSDARADDYPLAQELACGLLKRTQEEGAGVLVDGGFSYLVHHWQCSWCRRERGEKDEVDVRRYLPKRAILGGAAAGPDAEEGESSTYN